MPLRIAESGIKDALAAAENAKKKIAKMLLPIASVFLQEARGRT